MMRRRRRVEDDGVLIRLGDTAGHAPRYAIAAACATMLVLCAATCWRWSGAKARSLSLDQAVSAAEAGDIEAVRAVYLRMKEARTALQDLARREDVVGERARTLLALIDKK